MQYGEHRGDASLVAPQVTAVDEEIAGAMSGVDADTLLTFANRAAVFALRERSETWLQHGWKALETVESQKADPRDVASTRALLGYAAERLGIRRRRWPRFDIGFREVDGPAGLGLVRWGFRRYAPTLDMLQCALRLFEVAEDEGLHPDVTLASELPPVWFSSGPEAKRLLKRSRATVWISGDGIILHIVEAKSAEDAARLAQLGDGRLRISTSNGPLFCLLIAETESTIDRFAEPLRQALCNT